MHFNEQAQLYASQAGGIGRALELALDLISAKSGLEARGLLLALRKEAIDDMRQANIAPEFEMHHARIARPAIEAIEKAFDRALQKLD